MKQLMDVHGFVLRVYGIYVDPHGQLLLTDEFRLGHRMTKFPGGGLELGEGPKDCLIRECKEELGMDVKILNHFYTTGFFQPTWLLPKAHQLISIYYLIDIPRPYNFIVTAIPFDYGEEVEGAQCFRFKALKDMQTDELSFPIDQFVLSMLKGTSTS